MKKFLTLVLALAMTLSLVACGGSSNGGSTASSGDKTSLTVAVDQDYATLHPMNTSLSIETNLTNQIYDYLAIDNPDDPSGDMLPRVAESWEVSDDGLCYTFHLRKGVKFHDGSELTAADVGFSLDLCAASEYQGAMVDGMDHWEIVDEYTINVYTEGLYSPFLRSVVDVPLACKAYYESVDENTFAQQPVGCGPYKFVSHNQGDSFVIEAFEDYYGGAPEIKKVTFKVIADAASMSIGLQAGQIDFAEIDASVLSTLEASSAVDIVHADQTAFYFVTMNTEKEPFSNVKFRQAINYAIDREALGAAVLEGEGTVNSNLLTPDRQGYSDSQTKYTYDPDKAKALLAECGYADGYDMGKFIVAESYKLMAQVVQSDLEKVGLTCTIEILEFNAYLDKLLDGDFTVTCLNMALQGDTQQLSLALCKDSIGMANNARWSDPKVEELFKKAVATVDEDERTAVYEELFAYVQDQAVYCVLCNPNMLFAKKVGLETGTIGLEGVYFFQNFKWVG